MYKVIIAEDEMFVRLGIRNAVDWEKMGMEVVADVENGSQVLTAYQTLKPDLILTDIRMPVLDGISLIRQIRQTDKRTRFIILSCLEEFDVVRNAISLGVTDYVLKLTMSQEDMERVLEKARKELVEIDSHTNNLKQDGVSSKIFADSLKNYLYYRLEMGKEQKKQFERYFSGSAGGIRMVVLEVDRYGECKERLSDPHGQILEFAIENILRELIQADKELVIPEKNGRFLMILEEPLHEEELWDYLNHIRKPVADYLKSTISFGVSERGRNLEDLYEMYNHYNQVLESKFFYGLNKNNRYPAKNEEECQMLIEHKMDRLIRGHKNNEEESQRLHEAKIAFCQHKNPVTIRQFFEHSINDAVRTLYLEETKRYRLTEQFVRRIDSSQTMDEVLEIYENCINYLSENSREGGMSKPVKDILRYISIHYQEDISLDQIAHMVELSRTYVSGLFKKEMGINLTNYILNYRIGKAKELLAKTNLKLYEVARLVGFEDESYFSRAFKKVTGESPIAYKKFISRGLE